MKKNTSTGLVFAMLLFFGLASTTMAQSSKAVDMFKNHINNVVQKVKKAETPQQKRAIMNSSFDKLLTSFNKVEGMGILSTSDQAAISKLQNNITEKKNELNGVKGYQRVPDNQLNNYANYVQQNLEQADSTITISVTVLLLIVILIILLA